MDVVVKRCAGLDVHRDNVVATVRVPSADGRRWERQTRTFEATLSGLAQLGDWLTVFAVTLVGMEATGVYWKTVFQALEDRFECWLLNAQHMHVNGHRFLPAGGHEFPHWWPSFLPAGGHESPHHQGFLLVVF